MSSLQKDPRGWSKFWICCYTSADGRQRKRSTRETDKNRARIVCETWERAESLGRSGLLTSDAQFRRVLEQGFERLNGKKIQTVTVAAWLERWLKGEARAVAPTTYTKYKQVTGDFLAFMGARTHIRLEAVTTDDLTGYRDHLLADGRSPRTVNNAVRKIMARVFTAAVDQGVIDRNPVAGIRHLRDYTIEKGTFTPSEVARLLAVADPEWKGLIVTAYFTGGRMGDLARLTWSAIDMGERSIAFRQGKTGAKLKIPIHPELYAFLASASLRSGPLFPTLSGKPGSGQSGLSMEFKRIMARAGIDGGLARERTGRAGRSVARLSFHSLRHSFVTALASAGVPPELRKKLSGHLDDKSHATYSHHEFAVIAKALESIPGLPKV